MGTTQLLRMHLSMKIIKMDDISVSQRLREIDRDKVDDLVESIRLIGLLHPIVIQNGFVNERGNPYNSKSIREMVQQ